jgi:hypothetical protein
MKHTTAPGPKTLDPSMGLRTAPSATSAEWSPQSGRSASAPRALVTVARRALHARFSWSSSWSSSASALDGRASARACVQLASATATSSDSPTSAANVNPHDSARVRARARSSGRAKRARAPRWPEPGERSRRASSSAGLAQLTRAGEPARGALPADFPNRSDLLPSRQTGRRRVQGPVATPPLPNYFKRIKEDAEGLRQWVCQDHGDSGPT